MSPKLIKYYNNKLISADNLSYVMAQSHLYITYQRYKSAEEYTFMPTLYMIRK